MTREQRIAAGKALAPTLNLQQFASLTGGRTHLDLAEIRSASMKKCDVRRREARTKREFREAMSTLDRYWRAVQDGRIKQPKRTLEDIAAGHPDNESVQAARRALARRRAVLREAA